MKWAERVAGHVNGETVVTAALFQRRGSGRVGDEGGMPSGAASELEAPGFPSNTIFAVTDAGMLYAFHKNPDDGLIGRWPLAEVGARLEERESNWNHLEIVGSWELLLTFPSGRSGAFESSKRDEDCKATCRAIAAGAGELTRNLPKPRSLDPNFTDWDPDDIDTWDERIVMVADEADFLEWQREWLEETGRS
ncbi:MULTISPECIES: hypothetical protein [unclassified Mycobacterium]|uniref:hypothetical protein n=1 Tax=unclassified Mycobacterium TaxID=2642494 RepID=UPI0029C78C91|nr:MULTISPECIES: hypothetical protein [unclassified Mycobacterium]